MTGDLSKSVQKWLPMTRAVVARTVCRMLKIRRVTEDHYATGVLGLCKALRTYDSSRGAKLSTHIWNCVKYAILSEAWQNRWDTPRGYWVAARKYVHSLEAYDALRGGGGGIDADPRSIQQEILRALAVDDCRAEVSMIADDIADAASRLPEKQQEALSLYVNGECSFSTIGEWCGVSTMAVWRRYHKAVKKIQQMVG